MFNVSIVPFLFFAGFEVKKSSFFKKDNNRSQKNQLPINFKPIEYVEQMNTISKNRKANEYISIFKEGQKSITVKQHD